MFVYQELCMSNMSLQKTCSLSLYQCWLFFLSLLNLALHMDLLPNPNYRYYLQYFIIQTSHYTLLHCRMFI